MHAGLFISFEGGEGVGKSSNMAFCADWLEQHNIPSIITREPGGSEISELIRSQLLKANHTSCMQPMTELLLVLAARHQHIEEVIKPALACGKWVLCDRFIHSTLAYQGYARGLSLELIMQLSQLSDTDFMPDLTLLLDAPLSVSQQRITQRAAASDRFEQEHQAFFEKVRDGFLHLANTQPNIKLIDASVELSQVQASIAQHLQTLLQRHSHGN